jgi:hypothetical protein
MNIQPGELWRMDAEELAFWIDRFKEQDEAERRAYSAK